MLYVMARLNVKPESAAAALALLTTLVNETRKEAGCLGYELFQRPDAPHVFQTVEQWTDRAAADAHMKSPHVGAAIAAAGSMFTSAPEIVMFDKVV